MKIKEFKMKQSEFNAMETKFIDYFDARIGGEYDSVYDEIDSILSEEIEYFNNMFHTNIKFEILNKGNWVSDENNNIQINDKIVGTISDDSKSVDIVFRASQRRYTRFNDLYMSFFTREEYYKPKPVTSFEFRGYTITVNSNGTAMTTNISFASVEDTIERIINVTQNVH